MTITTVYDPAEETITINIDGVEESMDWKEFLNDIPTEEARAEYILALIHEKRTQRFVEMSEFIDFIKGLVLQQNEITKRMNEAIDRDDMDKIKMLEKLNKTILDTKNTGRELRHAAKALEIEEGRLKSRLLEMHLGKT